MLVNRKILFLAWFIRLFINHEAYKGPTGVIWEVLFVCFKQEVNKFLILEKINSQVFIDIMENTHNMYGNESSADHHQIISNNLGKIPLQSSTQAYNIIQ